MNPKHTQYINRVQSSTEHTHRQHIQLQTQSKRHSLAVEVIYLLHVTKNDVLFVSNARWNLLYTVGHLPQVRLTGTQSSQHKHTKVQKTNSLPLFSPLNTPEGL